MRGLKQERSGKEYGLTVSAKIVITTGYTRMNKLIWEEEQERKSSNSCAACVVRAADGE